jgi:hypothetical protein
VGAAVVNEQVAALDTIVYGYSNSPTLIRTKAWMALTCSLPLLSEAALCAATSIKARTSAAWLQGLTASSMKTIPGQNETRVGCANIDAIGSFVLVYDVVE